MSRRLLLLLSTALVFVLPAAVHAQSRDRATGCPASSVECVIFQDAFEKIARMHLSGFSDSTLYARALDGLIEQLGDPYASVFTPVEVEEFEEETTGNYAGIGVS